MKKILFGYSHHTSRTTRQHYGQTENCCKETNTHSQNQLDTSIRRVDSLLVLNAIFNTVGYFVEDSGHWKSSQSNTLCRKRDYTSQHQCIPSCYLDYSVTDVLFLKKKTYKLNYDLIIAYFIHDHNLHLFEHNWYIYKIHDGCTRMSFIIFTPRLISNRFKIYSMFQYFNIIRRTLLQV